MKIEKSKLKMKNYGKAAASAMCAIVLVFVVGVLIQAVFAQPGQIAGENKIPLGRDKAVAPYAVFQCWMGGSNTAKCFDGSDDTVKAGATYANCAVRFEQDAVSKIWWLTVPATLDSGSYVVIIRTGTDGAEANTDTDVVSPVITWDKTTQSLKVVLTDVFVSY